jgi:hypothetical protein
MKKSSIASLGISVALLLATAVITQSAGPSHTQMS